MSKWPELSNPPIIEALLDIRCKLPSGVHLDSLAILHEAIRDRYPNRRERRAYEASFQIKPEGQMEVLAPSGQPDGYLFTSADGRQTVQVRLDGFTFNRLKPYVRWETFRNEAKVHWRAYAELAKPETISRIALRYINRIEVPLPVQDFREYVLTTPEIGPGLPQGLSNFLMRLEIPEPRSGSIAIITETMEPPKDARLPLILDIDVIRETLFDPRSENYWEVFEQLHDFASEIFFRTVTDKANELFQ